MLKDHWEKGKALKILHEGHWDFVVLQDQSLLGIDYFVEGRPRVAGDQVFRPYAEKWAAEIRKAGATPLFYLTWARKATPDDQPALNYAYMHAAHESKAMVAPVGIAWDLARRRYPAIELFTNDGSHPSPAGSYLAACTLYATVFGHNPIGLPAKVSGHPILHTGEIEAEKTVVLVDLPPDEARALQAEAWVARQQLMSHGGYLNVSHVPVPSVVPLPAGERLSRARLEGIWTGTIAFYHIDHVEMMLRLQADGAGWKGHLELKYHSKNFPDESFDLTDLRIDDRTLIFTNPKSVGVDNLKVSFRGVSPRAHELRGTAETISENPDSTLRLLGTWRLHQEARSPPSGKRKPQAHT